MNPFFDACGAGGPLAFDIEGPEGSEPFTVSVERPAAIIGRHEEADVVLDHPDVGRRHAYVQVIAGLVYCLDLESRSGTFRGGDGDDDAEESQPAGWIAPGEAIRIGPYRVRVRVGQSLAEQRSTTLPRPTSTAFADQFPDLPPTWLEANDGGPDGRMVPLTLRRVLTLIGRSASCKLRVPDERASRFHGAMIRSPLGPWFVDLLPTRRVRINGGTASHVRLGDGDELQIGPYWLRVRSSPPKPSAGTSLELARPSSRSLVPASPMAAASLSPLPPLLPRGAPDDPLLAQLIQMQQQMSDQFQQSMVLISRVFGSMHRDHMELVREELAEIRRITREMDALKHSDPAPSPSRPRLQAQAPRPSLSRRDPEPATEPDSSSSDRPPASPTPEAPPAGPRPHQDPFEVHALVTERLAMYESERRGRWDKILKILAG